MCVARTQVAVPDFHVRRPTRPGEVDLLWSVLPEVAMLLIGSSVGARGPIRALAAWARNLARAFVPTAGPRLTRVGSVLVVDTSVQTERVTSPLVEALALRRGEPAVFRLPLLGARSATMAALGVRRIASRLAAALSDAGAVEPPGLRRELLKVEILRRRAGAVDFRAAGVDAVVVGTQQNSSARALLSVARREGIATYYLPHAPVADNDFYRDIPTTFALVRGPAEVDFYTRIGAAPTDGLIVVGSPGLAQPPQEMPPQADDIVYAPSPHAPAVLQADIAVLRGATDRPVMVCLHPRMGSTEFSGLFPPEWHIADGPNTEAYLRRHGAQVVIQHGSGVGLEALSLGIEVIDLCSAGQRPNYPYIRAPHVQVVHDVPGLRAALHTLEERANERGERVAFARSWCSDAGAVAARRCVEAIEQTRSTSVTRDVLLDGWDRFLSNP